MMNELNYDELIKKIRYDVTREELETIKRSLDKDKTYNFTKTSSIDTLKDMFVDIKDTFRGRDLFISLFRKSIAILGCYDDKPGFINRYEIEWSNSGDIDFVRKECIINDYSRKCLILNEDSHRDNNKQYVTNSIVLYKPMKFY